MGHEIANRLPATKRECARATREAPHPFRAGGPSRLPDDLAKALLDDQPRAKLDDYDRRVAYALAVIAGWSYADAKTLSNKLKYYGLSGVTVRAFAVTNPAMLIVSSAFLVRSRCGRIGMLSFRGTEPANIISWLTDADLVLRGYGSDTAEEKVHRGFFANLQAVWEEIVSLLTRASSGTQPGSKLPLQHLYITGHSLGGAMAVLAAAELLVNDRTALEQLVRGVYTFGQPAVGNPAFAAKCDGVFGSRLYRHIYAHDVVAHLPPSWGDGHFQHFGREFASPGATKAWAERQNGGQLARWLTPALASCVTSFAARRLPLVDGIPLPYSLDDHSPTPYIETSRASL